jgi:hypothetical protein
MSDITNKDDINNKLSDDGVKKPLKRGKKSKTDKVNPENSGIENSDVVNNTKENETVSEQELLEPAESQELLEPAEPQELLEPAESQELLKSAEPQELLEPAEPQELLKPVEPQELLKPVEPQELLKSVEPQELLESGENTQKIENTVAEITETPDNEDKVVDVTPENVEESAEVVNKEELETSNSKDSNYQVSLIDERILKVRTSTNQSVSIDCNLFIKEEVQSNKIFVHPKAEEEKQEIEVVVKIGDAEPSVEENTEAINEEAAAETAQVKKKPESNYQVSLINENVLRIKISTNKSVSVDCSILDKTSNEEGEETQSNKIFIKPKHGIGKQDVAIFIKIGSEIYKETDNSGAARSSVNKPGTFQQNKLTPNPLVADLIQKFSKPKEPLNDVDIDTLTPEEVLELKIGRKNPWRQNKEFLTRNLYRGFVAANIIAIITMIVFYAFASKKPKEEEVIEQKRLIVMQDLPENLNKLSQSVDDPNKPEPPKEETSTDGSTVTPPIVTPKKIRPPRVNLPLFKKEEKDTNDTAINKELDSLRKKNVTVNNGNTKDTGAVNTSIMADSLLKNLTENEVGLVGRFPPNWKQIDARTINQKDDFLGILLVDTTVKKEETITMNIELDPKGEKFNQFQFKKVFDEDSLRTVYSIDPKQEGKMTFYRFYVANKTDNIFINAYVIQSAFDKYKGEIERVVKSVRIQKPIKK